MCKCIHEFEKKMEGREHKGKKVVKAELISSAIMLTNFSSQTCGQMELTLEGRKRPIKQPVVHNYCPFCGKKYSDPNNSK